MIIIIVIIIIMNQKDVGFMCPPSQTIYFNPFFFVGNFTLFSIVGLAAAPGMSFNQAEGRPVTLK